MALIDDIEFYGRAVAAGEMTRDAATQALADASEGGLTRHGAGESIDNWQACRADYRNGMLRIARVLDEIYGLDDTQP